MSTALAVRRQVARVAMRSTRSDHARPTRPSVPRSSAADRLCGRGHPGGIGLTFDDGPDPAGTPAVLDALGELGWSATFFMLGSQARQFPEMARAVVAAGHEVAVHGDSHRSHLVRSTADVRADVIQACRDIAALTGVRPRWFRPPYGFLSRASVTAAAQVGLTPVLWTTWGKDWEKTNSLKVLEHVLADLDDGGTVLLHDSDCTSTPHSWKRTAWALPRLAVELDRRGLAVRPLREHLVDQT